MVLNALLFGGIAGAATLAGIALVRWKQDLALRYSHYISSFAAGALITTALVHLIPESVEMTGNALSVVLGSFLVFYLLEAGIAFNAHSAIHFTETRPKEAHTKAPVIFCGLFLHSLIDGFIITAGFAVSLELGLLAATGVILHELPEGITSLTLLMRSIPRRTALILSVAVALATPVGVTIALGPLNGLSVAGLGVMIAIAGGSFLYIAASDLIPETHERDVLQNVISLLTGVGLLYLLTILFE